jgi:hypothetical protein
MYTAYEVKGAGEKEADPLVWFWGIYTSVNPVLETGSI